MAIAALIVRIAGDTSGFSTATQQAARDAQRMGDRLKGIGTGLTVGVTAPLTAIGVAAVQAAADAEAAGNKFQDVFGDAAGAMQVWVNEVAKTVPQANSHLQRMTAEVQDLLVPLGIIPGEAQNMTKQIVQLAADLSAFEDIPMEETLAAIRSGLIGQSEPMLKFGSVLNVARVEAEALNLGLIQQGEKMDAAARAAAAFSLIMQDTKTAQGASAREAESASVQFARLKAQFTELLIVIGQQLLPVVVPLVSKIADLISKVATLNPAIVQIGLVLAGVAAAAGPVLIAFGSLATLAGTVGVTIGTMLGIVTGVGAVFAAAVAAGVLLYKNWDTVKAAAQALWQGVKTYVGFIGDVFEGTFKFIRGLGRILFAELDELFGGRLTAIVDLVKAAGGLILDYWKFLGRTVTDIVRALIDAIREHLVGRFTAIVDSVKQKLAAMGDFFKDLYIKVAGASYIPDMMDIVAHELGPRLEGVQQTVALHTTRTAADFKSMADQSAGASNSLLEDTKTFLVDRFADEVVAKSKDQLVSLAQGFIDAKGNILGVIGDLVSGLKAQFLDRVKAMVTDFLENWDKVLDAVKDAVDVINQLAGRPQKIDFNSGPFAGPGIVNSFTLDLVPLQEIGERQITLLTEIRDRLSGPAGTTASLSRTSPAASVAGGGGSIVIENLNLPGVTDVDGFLRELQRRARSSGDEQRVAVNTLAVLAN